MDFRLSGPWFLMWSNLFHLQRLHLKNTACVAVAIKLPKFNHIFAAWTSCVRAAIAVATWLSVCLSRWCIVPKWLSRSSCDLHRIVAQPFYLSCTIYEPDSSSGFPSLRASTVVDTLFSRLCPLANTFIQAFRQHVSYCWALVKILPLLERV